MHPAVLAGEEGGRVGGAMAGVDEPSALPAGEDVLALEQGVVRDAFECGSYSLDGRNVDVLPFAGEVSVVERGENGHGCGDTAVILGLVATGLEGFTVRVTRDVHVTAEGIGHDFRALILTVRALLTEVRDGGHYQRRVDLRQAFVVQPEPREIAGLEGLDDDV